MDISGKYIEMCSKATEIQELRKVGKNYQEGDFFSESSLCAAIAYSYPSNLEYAEDGFMDQVKQKESHESWLPRQDQLQEMITTKLWRLVRKISDFHIKNYAFLSEATMEQLWLAFVMKEKCNKIWNEDKKEWINE